MLGLYVVTYISNKKFQSPVLFLEANNKEEARLIADCKVDVKEVISVKKILPKKGDKRPSTEEQWEAGIDEYLRVSSSSVRRSAIIEQI